VPSSGGSAAGSVVPERTIADHLDLAAAAGAALHFRTEVQGWELTATGVRVHTGTAVSLRRALSDRLADLADHWLSGTACMYTVTPDRNFVVGSVAGTDARVTVAAGFSGHGFKFVPVIGEIVADLATHGSTALDISLFDPRRFDPSGVA